MRSPFTSAINLATEPRKIAGHAQGFGDGKIFINSIDIEHVSPGNPGFRRCRRHRIEHIRHRRGGIDGNAPRLFRQVPRNCCNSDAPAGSGIDGVCLRLIHGFAGVLDERSISSRQL